MQVSFEHIHSVLLHDKYTCKTERNVLCKAGSTGKKKALRLRYQRTRIGRNDPKRDFIDKTTTQLN